MKVVVKETSETTKNANKKRPPPGVESYLATTQKSKLGLQSFNKEH